MSLFGLISLAVAIALGMVWSYGIAKGFDLKSRAGWLYTLCAFLAGFLGGSVHGDLALGFRVGLIATLMSLWGGPTMDRINKGR